MLEIDCKMKLMNSTNLVSIDFQKHRRSTAEFVHVINLKVRSLKSAIESVSSSGHPTLPQLIYKENNAINFCTNAGMMAKEHLVFMPIILTATIVTGIQSVSKDNSQENISSASLFRFNFHISYLAFILSTIEFARHEFAYEYESNK
uniref:Uncharacterized protein n=1 Tax=Glossina pallidipes TaxID=7398 RepID=A0A1B0A317_GLOPL